MRTPVLLLALVAFGCSEAQICRQQATSAVRSLERQITETEQNIARGYELIERPGRREYHPMWCPDPRPEPGRPGPGPGGPPPGAGPGGPMAERPMPPPGVTRRGPVACASPFPPDPVYESRPINVEAERAKLASLIEQRNRILPETQRALAQCPAD